MKPRERIRKFFVTRLLRIFLKREYYQGDYAENLQAMKQWFNGKHQGRVIVMRIEDTKFRFDPVLPQSTNMDYVRAIVREQARIHSRKLRKKHEVILYYVEDHFITRLFGCRPGQENKLLRA